jgi:asparagine synthase (glutamine-hydrolysing)
MARVLADYYGTDHTEVIVSGKDVRAQIEGIIRAMDQPSGDGLNTYFVSQATARYVKVALSGLGGDELFAGYPQFRMFRQAERASRVWRRFPQAAQAAAHRMASVAAPARRAITWLDGDVLARYARVRVLFDEDAKLALYTPEAMRALSAPESSLNTLSLFVHPAEHDPVAQLTRLELKHYMAHTLLRDTDAMSMAHSLEVRVPLIDHKIVEFAVGIPPALKLRDGRTKWIFAEALRDVLPTEILNRPKRGFEMPVASWMRHALHDVVEDALSRESIEQRGLLRHEIVGQLYQDFLAGRGPYLRVWALVVLELWLRQFIDQRARWHGV